VGGGARGFELRRLRDAELGVLAVFELAVDVRDAMGANVVNSMCEEIAPPTRGR
jgi:hydroxymethylglutaryl-CoA reductase